MTFGSEEGVKSQKIKKFGVFFPPDLLYVFQAKEHNEFLDYIYLSKGKIILQGLLSK